MLGIRHPFSRALYERDGNGGVLVTATTADGTQQVGRFTSSGRWIDGEIRECDLHLCGWVAGPIVGNHRMVEPAEEPSA